MPLRIRTSWAMVIHCTPRSISLFASDVPQDTCDAHLQCEIDLCYPNGRSGQSYCANNDCLAYNKIVNSAEFKALCVLFPELKRFQDNPLEHKTIYMLKDEEHENPTVEDALEANEIELCPVHTHQLLVELQQAVQEAMSHLTPEPEPEPEPGPEPEP